MKMIRILPYSFNFSNYTKIIRLCLLAVAHGGFSCKRENTLYSMDFLTLWIYHWSLTVGSTIPILPGGKPEDQWSCKRSPDI